MKLIVSFGSVKKAIDWPSAPKAPKVTVTFGKRGPAK